MHLTASKSVLLHVVPSWWSWTQFSTHVELLCEPTAGFRDFVRVPSICSRQSQPQQTLSYKETVDIIPIDGGNEHFYKFSYLRTNKQQHAP